MSRLKTTLGQAQRFLLVSGCGFAIDMLSYLALTKGAGLEGSWAKRGSFALVILWGFFAHKRFTFRRRPFRAAEPFRFALVYLAGWAINSQTFDAVFAATRGGETLAFLSATGLWAVFNFACQKWYVFRPSAPLRKRAAQSG